MRNYFFIVNPASGRGKGQELGTRLEGVLPESGLDYQLEYTKQPWHAAELAEKAARNFSVIVVVGGDGTMHEVLNGMLGSSADMGILPVGSGNDFVRAIDIPVHFNRAFEILLRGRRRHIDVGRVNDRYFHNGLGIGFDAHVVNTGMKVKKLRGNAIYLYAVLRTLITYTPVDLELILGEQVLKQDFFMLTAGNGVSLGGGFYLTPDAILDDGLFDLCMIRNMNRLSVIKNLLKVYSGKHKDDPRVDIVRTDSFQIHCETGVAVHADGELISLSLKNIAVNIVPKALSIIC